VDFTNLNRDGMQVISGMDISTVITHVRENFREIYKIAENSITPNKPSGQFTSTLSKSYGLSEFPFHTDGAHFVIPPRWVILEYLGIEKSGTATLVTDTQPIIRLPTYEDIFYNQIYTVTGGPSTFLTTIVNTIIYSVPIFRWNQLIMKPVNQKSHIRFQNINFDEIHRLSWYPNQIVILDNWRVLHGREIVKEQDVDKRILKRYNLTPVLNHGSI
jgi:L-asparagine oxygenase